MKNNAVLVVNMQITKIELKNIKTSEPDVEKTREKV